LSTAMEMSALSREIAGNIMMGDPQLDQVRTRWPDGDITTWCCSTA